MTERVAVVIPVYNERERLVEAVRSVVEGNEVSAKFYIVDDASTDGTPDIVKKFLASENIPHEVFVNDESRGAGGCRNIGLDNVVEEYILFLDADDFLFPGILDQTISLADESSSQVVITEYDRIYSENDKKLGMNHHDEMVFSRIKKMGLVSPFSINKAGFVLDLVNYPWNKLVSTSYAREIGLRFSETPVHNDVFAHWQLLMNASRISVMNQSLCGHRVSMRSNQITNISDARRMAMLDVFNELEEYFNKESLFKERYYHFFVSFKIKLFRWGNARIDEGHKESFYEEFCKTFENMSKLDFLIVSERMPRVAVEALRYRLRLM